MRGGRWKFSLHMAFILLLAGKLSTNSPASLLIHGDTISPVPAPAFDISPFHSLSHFLPLKLPVPEGLLVTLLFLQQ